MGVPKIIQVIAGWAVLAVITMLGAFRYYASFADYMFTQIPILVLQLLFMIFFIYIAPAWANRNERDQRGQERLRKGVLIFFIAVVLAVIASAVFFLWVPTPTV